MSDISGEKVFKDSFKQINTTLFLLFMATIGGFIGGNITSCAIQKIIQNKVWVSHLIFLIILYFTSSYSGETMSIKHNALLTLCLYAIFTIVMKNYYITLVLGMCLLLGSYMVEREIKYQKSKGSDTKNIKNLEKLKNYLDYAAFSTLSIGFIVYLMKQMRDKGSQFNFLKFFFGTGKCTNL